MPIYEYQCTNCHHQFDLLQKINDEPIKKCPECSKEAIVRLVSAAGFQLKGTGWYVTDFKDKGKGNSEKKSEHSTSVPSSSKVPASDEKSVEKKPTETSAVASTSTTTTSKGDSN